jgi:hypothetical protein
MWSFEPAGVELRTWDAFEARPVLVAHHFLAPSGSSLSGRLLAFRRAHQGQLQADCNRIAGRCH